MAKGGWVYGIETKRKSGKKKIYTGMTRNIKRRRKEHGV